MIWYVIPILSVLVVAVVVIAVVHKWSKKFCPACDSGVRGCHHSTDCKDVR